MLAVPAVILLMLLPQPKTFVCGVLIKAIIRRGENFSVRLAPAYRPNPTLGFGVAIVLVDCARYFQLKHAGRNLFADFANVQRVAGE